jgi:phenylpropionate dioxygenase-like ring-hydroxylating dioxygenase large terminal subunit
VDYLGDMRLFLDCALDHRDGSPGGSEVIGGVQKWRARGNWKLSAENFVGDPYHEASHKPDNLAEIGPSGGKGRRDEQRPRHAIGFPGLGTVSSGFCRTIRSRNTRPATATTRRSRPIIARSMTLASAILVTACGSA